MIKIGDIVFHRKLGIIFEVKSLRLATPEKEELLVSLRGSVFTFSWRLHDIYNEMDAVFVTSDCVIANDEMSDNYNNLPKGV
jgi:hypothetical protein